MKILIVDDDPLSLSLLQALLEHEGYEVYTAESGESGWEMYKVIEPALMIVDWVMPGMDGVTLCQKVRSTEINRYTYIILLTALTGKGHYLEGIDAGADDFMSKPFDEDELFARIKVAGRILKMQIELKQLEGLLNVCSYCKKIKDDEGDWNQMEVYISNHSEAEFSHGVCPSCYEKYLLPQLKARKKG